MNSHFSAAMNEIRHLMDEKSFTTDQSRIRELPVLIRSEISGAADARRKGRPQRFVTETLIGGTMRYLRLVSVLSEDPDKAYQEILNRNRSRPARWNTICGG